MQYGGGYSVQRRHTISTVEDIQYDCVTPSITRRHIISTVEDGQYGGGYAVRTCHTISTDVSHHQYGEEPLIKGPKSLKLHYALIKQEPGEAKMRKRRFLYVGFYCMPC